MSVVANVAINVDARGAAQKLQDFQRKSQAASKAADGLARATQKAGATAAKSTNQFSGASRSINSLIGTLGKLAAAYAGVRVAQAAIQAGIGRVESERRIQFLARSYGEVEQLASAAAVSASKFGESQTTANQALANAYARLRPVGVSLGDIVSTYNGFNTAARISGANSVEASNAFTQLAQALGSGALRGDEFNSIAEQVPAILTAISKETGVAQGALRDYAADGKITADVVIRALKRIETEGANQLEEALNGPQQKIKDFQNASEDLAVAFSRELIPQMTDAVKALASALRALEPILVGLGRVAAQVFTYIAGLANRIVDLSSGGRRAQAEIQASAEAQRVTREKFGLRVLSPEARAFREQYERNILFNFDAQERERKRAAAALPTAGAMPTGALPSSGTTGGGRGRSGGVDKAAREAERLAQEIERSLQAGRELGTQFQRQIMLMDAASETEKQRLQIQFDYEDRARQIAELKNEEQRINLTQLNDELRRLETIELQTEAIKKQAQLLNEPTAISNAQEELNLLAAKIQGKEEEYRLTQTINDLIARGADPAVAQGIALTIRDLNAQNKAIQSQKQLWADIYTTVAGQLQQAITGLIDGTTEWGDVLSNILGSLGNLFLNAAFSGLGGALNLPGFAEGGFVTKPTAAVVGEGSEPEYIIPASKMRTAMTRYAGGARGDSVVSGDGIQATATGGAATMEPIDVRYSVERINNVDYVTADQFQQGMAQAAEQGARRGEQRALYSLRQNTNTRQRIGL